MTVKDRKKVEAYRREAHVALDALLDKLGHSGALADLPSPDDLVRFGALAKKPRHELADLIGPVYDTSGVRKLTGWERQRVDDRRKRGTILALRTSDGVWVYPVFQFADGAVSPHVREFLDVFRHIEGVDWWTVAAWLTSAKRDLGGVVPIEAIDAEVRVQVLELAAEAATRWAA